MILRFNSFPIVFFCIQWHLFLFFRGSSGGSVPQCGPLHAVSGKAVALINWYTPICILRFFRHEIKSY